jgi:hypothetical protein
MLEIIQATVVDSATTHVATEIGNTVSLAVLAGLGVVNKYVVSIFMKVFSLKNKLTPKQKVIIALVWANVVVLINKGLAGHDIPVLPTDIDNLPYYSQIIMTWLVAMGWHGLSKSTGLDEKLKISA